jgi:uncharacterized protein (TIGR03000 family)
MWRFHRKHLVMALALSASGLWIESAHAQWVQYREDSSIWVSPRLYRPWGTLDGAPRWRFDGWWHQHTGSWGYSPNLHGEWFLRTGPPYKEYSFSQIREANLGDGLLEEAFQEPIEELPPAVIDQIDVPMSRHGRVAPDALVLAVRVPDDARVYVNDELTDNKGALRYFNSVGLEPGSAYVYRVRAEVVRDGKTITQTKVARVGAGKSADLDFPFESVQSERVAARNSGK